MGWAGGGGGGAGEDEGHWDGWRLLLIGHGSEFPMHPRVRQQAASHGGAQGFATRYIHPPAIARLGSPDWLTHC